MPKALRLLPVSCAVLALAVGTAAHGQEADPNEDVAYQSIQYLARYCEPDRTADEAESFLESEGWSRIGGGGSDVLTGEGQVDAILRDGRAISASMRAFHSEVGPQVILFTTSAAQPDRVRDCVVDGNSIEPSALASKSIELFGAPTMGEPGLAHWDDWLGTGHTLILANSMVANHDFEGAMMLVLRKEPTSE